jgi:opacity protein-like surface antigen
MKRILISAIAIFTFGIANAQDVKFGVKAGLNLATFSGDAVGEDVTMKAGFHAGGLVELKFTDKLSLQPEILFSQEGAKIVQKGFDGTVTYTDEFKRNLSYVNIPVMLKYYPVGGFYLEGGPQAGFLISAKSKNESTETDLDGNLSRFSSETDVKDEYKSVDFAFNLGLGYDFTPNWFAGARYNIGLSNINDLTGPLAIYEVDRKNSVLSFSVGYKF